MVYLKITDYQECFVSQVAGKTYVSMTKAGVVFLGLLIISLCLNGINGQYCTMTNSCACNMDDGSGVIDLSSIAKNDGTAA